MALTQTVNEFVTLGFGEIPEVERVYIAQRDNDFYVRVVVDDDRDRNLRRRIFAEERVTICEFKTFDFDFDLPTSAELVDPSLCLAYEKKKARRVDLS